PAPAATCGSGARAARAVPHPNALSSLRAAARPAPYKALPASATQRVCSDYVNVDGQGRAASPADAALPPLAPLTPAEPRWAAREADITPVGGDPF
ncbi:NYN domain-containing protein, partial [Streptomyces sp. JV186]|nr:NYN domain-containing protein [Streptomyces sp. JV186]